METLIDYKRQTSLFNPYICNESVSVVGLGNIGSNTAIGLARLGIKNLTLYDFDTVENHNLTSQYYDIDDLGMPKAMSLAEKIRKINPSAKVSDINFIFEAKDIDIKDILIIAVDSMAERKRLCEDMIRINSKPKLIIDGRVGGEQLEVYTCKSPKEWQKTFTDNPSTDPCGGRFICYVSQMVGAVITNQIKKFLINEKLDKSIMMNAKTLQVIKNFSW